MKGEKWLSGITGALLSAALGFSLSACLASALRIDAVDLTLLALFCVLSSVICAVCYSTKLGYLPICVTALLLGIFWQSIMKDAVESVLYFISAPCARAYGWKLINWSGRSAVAMAKTALPGLCLVSLPAVMASSRCVIRRKSTLETLLLSGGILLILLIAGQIPPNTALLGLALCALCVLEISSLTRQRDTREGLRLTALLILPVVLSAVLLFRAVPVRTDTGSDAVQSLRQWLLENAQLRRLSQLLTEKETESTVNGYEDSVALSDVGAWDPGDREILTVKADTDGNLYLRGRALDVYDGMTWRAGDEPGLLPWPQAFLTAAGSVTVTTAQPDPILYLPYYAVDADMEGNGMTVPNTGNAGTYTVRCAIAPADSFFAGTEEPDIPGKTVPYTALPAETAQWASPLASEITKDTKSVFDAANRIADYVRSSADYDTETPKPPKDVTDFARWFLQRDTGYCVHFATTAAVLLRASGIPARYVSGFLVQTKKGETVTACADDAHAWVEYWLPGFGWRVLEATPAREPVPVTTSPASSEESAETAPALSGKTLAALIVLGILVLAGISVLQGCVRAYLRRRKLKTGTMDTRALRAWEELERLCRVLGQTPEENLRVVAQKAKFSRLSVTEEELSRLYAGVSRYRGMQKKRNILARLRDCVIFAVI